MPLERARMRLRVVIPVREARKVRDKIISFLTSVEQEDWTPELEIVSSSGSMPLFLVTINEILIYVMKNNHSS